MPTLTNVCAEAAIIALAVTPTTAMAVGCSVSTLPASFGIYNPLQSAPALTTGTIEVACTCSVVDCVAFGYRIELSAGQSGNTAMREMRSGTGRLQYNLYTDASYTTIWGNNGVGLSMLYLVALFGSKQTVTVYARSPAGQNVPAGSYSDAPVATIFY